MKDYPSIPRSTGMKFEEIPAAYVFDKLDGRNVRVEWTRKGGFDKWGSRSQTFDPNNPEDAAFKPALPLFEKAFAEPLARIFTDNRWPKVTAFFELWQPNSLGGVFVEGEPYHLSLIDVAPDRQCIIGPKDYVKLFEGKVPIAAFLGIANWTRGFVELIRVGQVDGITFEGCVAKKGERHHQFRAKAKTQKWIDAILARYGEEKGRQIVES